MKRAAEILARLLERSPGAAAHPAGSLFGDWQEIAGLSLAEHCRVYDVRQHSLFVEADHPGWMQLLLLAKRTILGKIRQRFPQLEIRDLKVRVAAAPAVAEPVATVPVPTAPAASAEVEQAVAAVTDSGLKEKLRQLLTEIERRGTPKPPG